MDVRGHDESRTKVLTSVKDRKQIYSTEIFQLFLTNELISRQSKHRIAGNARQGIMLQLWK